MNMKLVKLTVESLHFYYHPDIWTKYRETIISSELQRGQFAEVIIDSQSNRFVKMIYDIESFVDFANHITTVDDTYGSITVPVQTHVDSDILDWLSMQVVNVRKPLMYGSQDMFWASPSDDDPSEQATPSNLREQCTLAMKREK